MPRHTSKGKFKSDFNKINHDRNHMKEVNLKSFTAPALHENQPYDLDIDGGPFGRILIKKLTEGIEKDLVILFIEDLKKVGEVEIVVKYRNNPEIDKYARLFLTYQENEERDISAQLFWAILPYKTKEEFLKNPSTYQRMKLLLEKTGRKTTVLKEREKYRK